MPIEPSEASQLTPELQPLARLAQDTLGDMSPEQNLRGELEIERRFTAKRRPAWLLPALAGAAIALASLVLVFKVQRAPAPLSYVVEDGAAVVASLETNAAAARTVRFSDGTELRVDAGTEARVRFVTEHGAAIAMARGALHAAVIHSATSEWKFEAGPFLVQVTGTAFRLAWDPEQDRFDLRLEHGSVTVTSPVANEPIPVRSGQWLTIRPRDNEVLIRDLTGERATEEPAAALDSAPPSTDTSPPPVLDSAAPAHGAPDTAHHWARELARGHNDEIIDDALRRGLDGCLAEANGSELSALADAARYTRRDEIARKALLAQRRRFAGSRRAVDASLLLGRLAQAEQDDAHALIWFDTYLSEAPNGAYASEALGRKLSVVRHSSGPAAARALAEQYLSRFPNGAYSSVARALSNNP